MKPSRPVSAPDPLLRRVVMIGIAEGKVVAKLYEEPGDAQADSERAAKGGLYEAVILAKPFQVRRRRP